MTLWEIDIYAGKDQPDLLASSITADAVAAGFSPELSLVTAHGYLIQADIDQATVDRIATELLSDAIVQQTVVAPVGDPIFKTSSNPKYSELVCVLPKPGVMDPVSESLLKTLADFGIQAEATRTLKKYWFPGSISKEQLTTVANQLLANDAIEQTIMGPLTFDKLDLGSPYLFEKIIIPIRNLDNQELLQLSKEGQLYLTLIEMQTIQNHFRELERDPTDAELESLAQTWSEHCSHKTLAGRIAYEDEKGKRQFENMLKETIFAATVKIRESLGDQDWCVSVFKDNAGIVRFDDQINAVFKVETHNHPSALEPYGGANTGIGGVIRDTLGTGLGAKPICNTDVFCFAPPNINSKDLPPGVLHPRRVMKGVVSGVRDYGNRMGIPTVNGAVFFDQRYLGNPLVYCGNVGIIPNDQSFKEPQAGDYIVTLGGRTGRDGIHGATFSSAELTSESESLSGGAVQIGNAITEKMVLDVILAARDEGLFSAVTDCGAGGFSSAVGEMGEEIGAEVWLDKAPLKYAGLSYTEIWISEAQERMVLSVPQDKWQQLETLCQSEGVEATIIGQFVPTGRLQLKYQDEIVADLSMQFLHEGRPPVIRKAHFKPAPTLPLTVTTTQSFEESLLAILGSLNVASKEWVIRQYDHEVQGGSVVKPLVGIQNDGPSDAAVVQPRLQSQKGLVISNGMNPHYGDLDPYHMAASAIDEAVRNAVATGADPNRIAILDNFCWGYTDRPETLGALVRAALACHDVAIGLETPFISGKDSLNNEFSFVDQTGNKQTIAIPPTLLISALGQIEDVRQAVTMDLKSAGNLVYLIGTTHDELGGSHYGLVNQLTGGHVPKVNIEKAKALFAAVHKASHSGLLRACHDLSEGGLAVSLAEMAFAGGWGADISLDLIPHSLPEKQDEVLLFSESNSRFLCEVTPENQSQFETILKNIPSALIGKVTEETQVKITHQQNVLIDLNIAQLKEVWQAPLRF